MSFYTALVFGLLASTSLGSTHTPPRYQNTRRQNVNGAPEAPLILSLLNSSLPFILPMFDKNTSGRAEEISTNRAGYLYGPSLLGNTSFFPTGSLGDALVAQEVEYFTLDSAVQVDFVTNESTQVLEAIEEKNLASYNILYDGQWKQSLPRGIAPGALTNYTEDLFFSMERLTSNPYIVERLSVLQPLPFTVDDSLVVKITGMSLTLLHLEGRLFYADHSYQNNSVRYPVGPGKFTAACQAYFYICPTSGDFLPLAIKPEPTSSLVYTPLDSASDWLLAKILFNTNDLFHGQVYHLAASHDVAEIVYEAALRTMSIKHPVRGFLDSLMYQAFSVRPVGTEILFNPGGRFDQAFSIGSTGALNLATDMYASSAGQFQANYLDTNFAKRGLINSIFGPPLKLNPYYEDAFTIVTSMRQFLTQYINVYYPTPSLISEDKELQNWVVEANGPAKVLDFPPKIKTTTDIVDILVHMAFLSGINHHVLNGNSLPTLPSILPFHSTALFSAPPTKKGITPTQLLTFLPNLTESILPIALVTEFNRPLLNIENKSLPYMFDSPLFLGDMQGSLVKAAQSFKSEMMALSGIIGGRRFDGEGLSCGLPFVWQILDPMRIPFFLNI